VPPPLSRGGLGIAENFSSSPEAPLGRGAVERSETERLSPDLFYHFLSQNSKTFEKALDFMKLK
jgi:hypothetical protein